MEEHSIKLIARSGNFAITQLSGRKYPSVTIQSDTLLEIFKGVKYCLEAAPDSTELASDRLETVVDTLEDMLAALKSACAEQDLDLPKGFVTPR